MGLFHVTMLALLVGALAEPVTEIFLSRTHARQGDEVTITCKITGYDDDSLVKINKYVRVADVDEETGTQKIYEQDVCINKVLEDPYLGNPRFSVEKVTSGETGLEYRLRITNVMPEDSAAYVCQIAGTSAYDAKTFKVYTMPDNVHFMNFSNWDLNIDILHFEEGQLENVGCMSMGGVPQPRFELIIGENNYTKKFKHHESNITLPDCYRPGAPLDSCPLHFSTETEVEAKDFRPFYSADGKYLECRAYIDGSGMEPKVARLKISMRYPPKFYCFMKHKVAIHTKNYELECTVYSNPRVEDVDLKFVFSWNGEKQTLTQGQEVDNEIKFLDLEKVSNTETKVSLRFDEVFERHYDTVFTLVAENELGQNSTNLQLVDEDYVRGAADTVVYSGILALVTCLMSLIVS